MATDTMRKLVCGLVGIVVVVGIVLFFASTDRVTCAMTVSAGGDVVSRTGPCTLNFGGGVLLRYPGKLSLVPPFAVAIVTGLLVFFMLLVTWGRRR